MYIIDLINEILNHVIKENVKFEYNELNLNEINDETLNLDEEINSFQNLTNQNLVNNDHSAHKPLILNNITSISSNGLSLRIKNSFLIIK